MAPLSKLSDFRIKYSTVELSDGKSYQVRALALADFMATFEQHQLDMDGMFQALMSGTISSEDKATTLMTLMRRAPELVSTIIACAMDEPNEGNTVLSMPIIDQISLGEAVMELTLKDGLLLKKIQGMVEKVNGQIVIPKSPKRR